MSSLAKNSSNPTGACYQRNGLRVVLSIAVSSVPSVPHRATERFASYAAGTSPGVSLRFVPPDFSILQEKTLKGFVNLIY